MNGRKARRYPTAERVGLKVNRLSANWRTTLLEHVRERFDRICELVLGVRGKWVQGVSQAALANEFERDAANPFGNINFLRAAGNARLEGCLELKITAC